MTKELIDTIAKYVIAIIVVGSCFFLIYNERGDSVQAWTLLGLVVGWLIRDSAGNSASANTAKIAAAAAPVVYNEAPAPAGGPVGG